MATLVKTIDAVEPVFDVRLTKLELNTIVAVMGAVPGLDVIKNNYNRSTRVVLEAQDYSTLYVALKKLADGGNK